MQGNTLTLTAFSSLRFFWSELTHWLCKRVTFFWKLFVVITSCSLNLQTETQSLTSNQTTVAEEKPFQQALSWWIFLGGIYLVSTKNVRVVSVKILIHLPAH